MIQADRIHQGCIKNRYWKWTKYSKKIVVEKDDEVIAQGN